MQARHTLAGQILAGTSYASLPGSYHLWLPLPTPWSTASFTSELARRGVKVSASDAFLAQRAEAPRAVRISISGPYTRARLADGLTTIRRLLDEGPTTSHPYL
jgi:DNA-binding transcriptional MocR family regulator